MRAIYHKGVHATINAMSEEFPISSEYIKRILIVGGGFGGVRSALELSKKKLPNVQITLVSDKHHFEYTPALYKLATGRSPLETCIPLAEIFRDTGVEIIVDTIAGGSLAEKVIIGGSGARFRYDYLVLALGSESAYFNIPGIKERSYTLKTVSSALALKRHLHELFDSHTGLSKGELMSQFQFVVVGGGPAGVELAGEIRTYARTLAEKHEVPANLITVDILQGAPRLLPTMPESVSDRVMRRLSKLGVNIILGRAVVSEDDKGVYLKDIQLNAKTIIWTAGVRPSHVYANIQGLTLDKGGKIIVDQHMKVHGMENEFVIGDSASTPFAGTAQTAIYDGHYVCKTLSAIILKEDLPVYRPRKTPYVIPVGPGWAVFTYKNITLSGKLFWLLREFIDFKFFATILPLEKAITAWREGGTLCESCPTCTLAENEEKK
jgi:NADH dehydrogenase